MDHTFVTYYFAQEETRKTKHDEDHIRLAVGKETWKRKGAWEASTHAQIDFPPFFNLTY